MSLSSPLFSVVVVVVVCVCLWGGGEGERRRRGGRKEGRCRLSTVPVPCSRVGTARSRCRRTPPPSVRPSSCRFDNAAMDWNRWSHIDRFLTKQSRCPRPSPYNPWKEDMDSVGSCQAQYPHSSSSVALATTSPSRLLNVSFSDSGLTL